MTSTSSSTSSTTPASALALGTSTATTPTRRRIVVDASKLRHGPAVRGDDEIEHLGYLIHPRTDCGCIIGLVLAACGVPVDDMVGESVYVGDHWPDFLPQAWNDGWRGELPANPLDRVAAAFDAGFEPTAAHMLIEMFDGVGVELVFEHFPDEVQVVDETDRMAS